MGKTDRVIIPVMGRTKNMTARVINTIEIKLKKHRV